MTIWQFFNRIGFIDSFDMQVCLQTMLIRAICRCLVVFAPIALSACALVGTGNDQPSPVVLFSHSEARVELSPAGSNTWSPTQWTQASAKSVEITPVAPRSDITARQDVTLFFATDVDQLSPNEAGRLAKFFDGLKQPETSFFEILGHTDNQHTPSYNQILSGRRARAIAQWLHKRGISPQRIRVDGLGLRAPRANNDTEAGRALNRRVELFVHSGNSSK